MLALLADQIRVQIRKALSINNGDEPVTCSIGAVFYAPQAGPPVRSEMLIREADRCMDEAHRKGGDQTILSSLEGGRWVAQSTTISV